MSVFTIQVPDGRKLKIEAADEATAIKGAQEWTAANPRPAPGGGPPPEGARPFGDANWQPKPGPGAVDFVSQGMSGVNEGIANTLGFPVEAANWAVGLGMKGINALTGSDLQPSEHPFGGQQTFRDLLAPTIRPESDDPALRATRRVGQEVGAMVIPGMGPVAKSSKPLQLAAKEIGLATASGTGAAVAQAVAPGNPLAEFAGQMVGSFTPSGVARLAKRPPKLDVPIDALTGQKNAAYKAVDDLGVHYSPQAYENLVVKVARAAKADNISPERHKAAYSFIMDMANKRGQAPTLTELDQLRQMVRRDLITPSYGNPAGSADAHFGQIILDEIDDFIATAGARDVVGGDAVKGAAAIKTARELNTRLRKSEIIEEALVKAQRRTESTGSGGNINNAIRQNIRAILDSPKKSRAFTKAELANMELLVRQGKMENLLRFIGKLSPSGNGLMAALGLGGAMLNPALGAASLAGLVAKGVADRGTINKAEALRTLVSRGQPPPGRQTTEEQRRQLLALLMAQGANQAENFPGIYSGPNAAHPAIIVNGGR